MKSVCFFGLYDPEYPRNKVLKIGFVDNGWQVLECRVDPRQYRGFSKYWQLFKEWKKLKFKPTLILVAYPGQTAVWLARLLFLGRPIIFDAFTSLYDSNVSDRQLYTRWSWKGGRDFLLDWYSLILADIVLTDTTENAKYFQKTFGIKAKKFIRVFVGTTIDELSTKKKKEENNKDNFLVHFHGHYIPLHGIEYIIKAAKILEKDKEIKFRIVGGGQEYSKIMKLAGELKPANIEFLSEVSFSVLADLISESDLVLGIFGTTAKVNRVIANKIFEGLALGKAIVTADTLAVRELLTDGENVLFCQAGSALDLAEKIALIKNDRFLSEKLSLGAGLLTQSKLRPNQLVANLLSNFKDENSFNHTQT